MNRPPFRPSGSAQPTTDIISPIKANKNSEIMLSTGGQKSKKSGALGLTGTSRGENGEESKRQRERLDLPRLPNKADDDDESGNDSYGYDDEDESYYSENGDAEEVKEKLEFDDGQEGYSPGKPQKTDSPLKTQNDIKVDENPASSLLNKNIESSNIVGNKTIDVRSS